MKIASILLAVFAVLGFVREAGAEPPTHDYSFITAGQRFGFVQSPPDAGNSFPYKTHFHMGPLGSPQVPFTAIQGLVGVGLILAMLIFVPAVLTVRWKKKRR